MGIYGRSNHVSLPICLINLSPSTWFLNPAACLSVIFKFVQNLIAFRFNGVLGEFETNLSTGTLTRFIRL